MQKHDWLRFFLEPELWNWHFGNCLPSTKIMDTASFEKNFHEVCDCSTTLWLLDVVTLILFFEDCTLPNSFKFHLFPLYVNDPVARFIYGFLLGHPHFCHIQSDSSNSSPGFAVRRVPFDVKLFSYQSYGILSCFHELPAQLILFGRLYPHLFSNCAREKGFW